MYVCMYVYRTMSLKSFWLLLRVSRGCDLRATSVISRQLFGRSNTRETRCSNPKLLSDIMLHLSSTSHGIKRSSSHCKH